MTRLGYHEFAVQGGDIGGDVAPEIGRLAPERVIGVHVNGALGPFAEELDDDSLSRLSPIEQDRMRRVGEFMQNEFGYIAVQSTRPALIGAMAADSPVAQLTWMLDKLQAWSHPADTPAAELLGEEFVLANASLYWFTASAGSAAYVGYAQGEGWGEAPADSGVPTAAIQFAHDIGLRHLAEQSNTIVRWTDVDTRGGHFAALEEPDVLVGDLREFLRPLRAHPSTPLIAKSRPRHSEQVPWCDGRWAMGDETWYRVGSVLVLRGAARIVVVLRGVIARCGVAGRGGSIRFVRCLTVLAPPAISQRVLDERVHVEPTRLGAHITVDVPQSCRRVFRGARPGVRFARVLNLRFCFWFRH